MPALASLSRDGAPLELADKQVEDLRAGLRGPLLREGDVGYDAARAIWNGMIDRRPALIARCLGTADVQACLRFARETGIALSMKGGGHNIAGLAIADRGLMIDMSLQRGVWVDPRARVARAQAGCLLGDVDRETQVHGLATVLGFISLTGIAGLTLGGGFGYTTRRWGWTSDNVRSLQLVTADGTVVSASESEHPDLFWALRGGGGNFGVLTGVEYELHELGPEIYGGAIAWRAEDAAKVLEAYVAAQASASPELTMLLFMRLAPPAPWIEPDAHGQPVVGLFVCHSGRIEEGERLLAPLRAAARPVGDVLQRRSYVSQQSIVDTANPNGRRYYWKSEYLPGVDPALLEAMRAHLARITSPHSAMLLLPLDGALHRLPGDHSAVGNRDARAVFNIASAWDNPADDARHVQWARDAWQDLRRFSTGGTYVNFLNEDDEGERIEAAYGANMKRLVAVKTRWDPENLFRVNKNIAPARG